MARGGGVGAYVARGGGVSAHVGCQGLHFGGLKELGKLSDRQPDPLVTRGAVTRGAAQWRSHPKKALCDLVMLGGSLDKC